ncbi:DAD family-domain-containing protein [Chaetomium fimeti]|uniref:Dolichyl-diphosphooligosaccharide--protein glycosyltransferase subunit OST2 n=1 Tax=Chaetomium fimeti TaxID=1854472 RepID=A0AAE0HQV9_9PEZI|nr:DAD family-domain-containing protein [Chaetomium fimeti]
MSQATGAGAQGTRAANSGPQAVRSNPRPRSGPTTPNIWLRMEPDDPSADRSQARDVNPGTPLHEAVTACVMVALGLMRSDQGKYTLPYTGEDVFKYVREPSRRTCTESSGLQAWSDDFVAQLSKDFVRVSLTTRTNPRTNGSDMWFQRMDWKSWRPDTSGIMCLNKFAIEAMVKAKQGKTDHHRRAYDAFAFAIGLEIARGLVFCFFGSLAPFSMEAPPSRGRDLDEAWEDRMFQGEIHNVMDPEDELGRYQAGALWFIAKETGKARRIMVPPGCGTHPREKFKLPLVTTGEEIDRAEFWDTRDAMADLRSGNLVMPHRQQAPRPARPVATPSANANANGAQAKQPAKATRPVTTTTAAAKTTTTTTAKPTTTTTATATATTNGQRRTAANTTGSNTTGSVGGNGAGRGAAPASLKANAAGTVGSGGAQTWDRIAHNVVAHYSATTPQRTKLLDAFLAFLVAVGGLQFAYCVLAGNYPFNAFLSGFSATVGQFVLTASLRIQTTEANKGDFPAVSPERAFADYVVCSLILHFFCVNFIN